MIAFHSLIVLISAKWSVGPPGFDQKTDIGAKRPLIKRRSLSQNPWQKKDVMREKSLQEILQKM